MCCWMLSSLTGVNHSLTWMKISPGVKHYMEWYKKKNRTRPVSYFKANFSIKLQQSKEIFFNLISSLKLLCRVLVYGAQQTSFWGALGSFLPKFMEKTMPNLFLSSRKNTDPSAHLPEGLVYFCFYCVIQNKWKSKKLFAAVISTRVFTALEICP